MFTLRNAVAVTLMLGEPLGHGASEDYLICKLRSDSIPSRHEGCCNPRINALGEGAHRCLTKRV